MDKETYQSARSDLFEQLEQLKSCREKLVHEEGNFFSELPPDVRHKLYLLDRDISRLQVRDLKIAFVGGFSAGKSSLINALIGAYILPESTDVTTTVPTYLRAAKGKQIAEAHYLTQQEISELYELFCQELAKKFDQPNLVNATEQEILETIRQMSDTGIGQHLIEYFKLFLEKRKEYHAETRGRVEQLSLDRACELIRNEKEAMFLDRIEFHLKINMPEDVVLVDLPGVSVPNPRHRRLTFHFISHEAHALLFVLMASRLFDTDETKIMEVICDGDTKIREKTFWILNRWDSLKPQHKSETVNQFEQKLRAFGISEGISYFKTNALHGLTSQIAMRQGISLTNPKLKAHMEDYLSDLNNLYGGSHEKALQQSEIPLLRNKLLTFINDRIRLTTIESVVENTSANFIKPLIYHLKNVKIQDEKYIDEEHNESLQGKLRERLETQIRESKKKIKDSLGSIREYVVINRKKLFADETEELEGALREAIEHGDQTDAYKAYLDIIANRKFRKYPYYFEIEIMVVDNLNILLKEYFRKIVRKQALTIYQDLEKEVTKLVSELGSNVSFDAQVMAELEILGRNVRDRFEHQTMGMVDQKAALLDELLLYKPTKSFWRFGGGNEIINGLEAAAQMVMEHIERTDESIRPEDMMQKTLKIRSTLKEHYIDKALKFRDEVADGFWGQVRDIMIDMEENFIQKLNGLYRIRLEAILKNQIENEFAEINQGVHERAKRFRDYIEVLQSVEKKLDIVKRVKNLDN